jgi:hypothetical protein
MFHSQIAAPQHSSHSQINNFPKELKSCSTSSSASSRAQSMDLLSQATVDSYAANSSQKTNSSNTPLKPTVSSDLSKQFSWSKDALKTPILAFTDKKLKKKALSAFKHIQAYFGDKKSKTPQNTVSK